MGDGLSTAGACGYAPQGGERAARKEESPFPFGKQVAERVKDPGAEHSRTAIGR